MDHPAKSPSLIEPLVPDIRPSAPVQYGDSTLRINLAPGEHAWVRRSSLITAEGPFDLKTEKISKKRFNVFGFFSGQSRWANRYGAKDAPVTILAGRDFYGTIITFEVTPDRPVHISPSLYLAHQGDLSLDTKKVAKKEFWTLTKVTGTGKLHIKAPGRPVERALSETPMVVDTNYVAAVQGKFTANGNVFKASRVMKSGELENVHLSGDGMFLLQSENPSDAGGGSGGGGIISSILDILPF